MKKEHRTSAWRASYVLVIVAALMLTTLYAEPVRVSQAADSGWRSPSADQADAFAGDGDGFEDHPEGAYASGGDCASNWDGYEDRHLYYGFGLDSPVIPADADITGIELRLEGWVDSASNSPRYDVDLSWDGGGSWSSARSTGILTDSQSTLSVGGGADLWGHDWSVDELSDVGFRARITSRASGPNCGERDFFLDWVAVRVTYNSAHIHGVVWSDVDADGVHGGAEAGLRDVHVTIYRDDGDGNFEGGGQDPGVGSGDTGADGAYDTGPFPDGYSYWIDVDAPANHYLTTPPEPRLVDLPDDNSIAVNFGYAPLNPAIEIAKTPDSQTVRVNSPVTFTICVTNTGDVALSDVLVTDVQAPDCGRDIGDLAAAAVEGYTCVVEDVIAGFTNSIAVEGRDPISGTVSASDTAEVRVIEPGIRIAKGPDQMVSSGSDVTFSVTVTNAGDVDLSNVTVTDAQAPDCDRDIGDLAVDGVESYTCLVEDVTDGFINSVIVAGRPPLGELVTDADAAKVILDETQPCPADMVAYWKLAETGGPSYDDFYDGHDGVCAEGQDCPAPATGHIDGGQAFDSTTGVDVPAIPGDESFDWGPTDSFSIEFWMSRPGTTPTGNEVIVGRDDGATALHWWAGIGQWAGNVAAFCLYDTGGTGTCVTGETVVTGGDWHHIVAVRDGVTKTIRIYVDGAEEALVSATYAAGFDSSTAALNVGWLNLSHGYHFRGILDEVALYDSALSADEIRRHHNEGLAGRWYCEAGTFAPIIVSNPVTEATSGRTYVYDVEAAGSPAPSYTLSVNPKGMTVNSATGLISWVPTVAQEGSHDVKVVASNSEGIDTQAFTITVAEGTLCPADMVAYWKLAETGGPSYDDFYDGHDGVCAEGQDCPAPATGHIDGGQAFDSTTGIDVPAIPGDESFDWGPTDSFSIEFWMSRPGTTPTGNEVIVGRDDSATALHWWAGIGQGAGNVAAFCLHDTGGTGTCVTGETVVTGGDWHHIVAVRDGVTNTIRIYVDGAEEASVSATYAAGFDSSTAALNVGWLNLSHGYHFRGILDEVALYDRVLSVEEIRYHHDVGEAGPGYCINPDISVTKIADPPVVYPGDTVTYTYSVTNPGDAPLSGVRLTDDKCSSVDFLGGDNGDGELDPGESWIFHCLTNLDKDTTNTATVTGTHRLPDGTVLCEDTVVVDVINPEIVTEKTADATTVDAGDTVTYTYTVTNTGDDPLSGIDVSDDKCGAAGFLEGDDNHNYVLDPNEIWTYICSMELSATTTNTGIATGTDSAGRPVVATDTVTVEVNDTAHVYLPVVLRSR